MTENRAKPDQFQLRFPPGLRARVKEHADNLGRSMNEDIIRILEDAMIDQTFNEHFDISGKVEHRLAASRKEASAFHLAVADFNARIREIDDKLDKLIDKESKNDERPQT